MELNKINYTIIRFCYELQDSIYNNKQTKFDYLLKNFPIILKFGLLVEKRIKNNSKNFQELNLEDYIKQINNKPIITMNDLFINFCLYFQFLEDTRENFYHNQKIQDSIKKWIKTGFFSEFDGAELILEKSITK